MIFSRVLHNENHVLHPLTAVIPERNDHGYELRRRRHERGHRRQSVKNDGGVQPN